MNSREVAVCQIELQETFLEAGGEEKKTVYIFDGATVIKSIRY